MNKTFESRESSITSREGRSSAAVRALFASFVTGMFAASEPDKVIALVSTKPKEGVSYTANLLNNFLVSDMKYRSILLPVNEFVEAGRMEERMSALRDEYDAVLLDCGAIENSASSLRIASMVDGFLIVVAAGETDKAAVRQTRDLIETARGHVLGVLLNKVQDPIPGWLKPLFR